jgi:hypothetical protein
MATRSRIGLQLSDDSIVSVYCHYDGYPAHNGRVLRTHYDTIEKVRELIDGGDMSCTWTNAGWNNETLPETGALYYSARGEDCPPRHDETMTEFFNNGEEFGYIYQNGEWFCYDTKTWSDTFAQVVEIPEGAMV